MSDGSGLTRSRDRGGEACATNCPGPPNEGSDDQIPAVPILWPPDGCVRTVRPPLLCPRTPLAITTGSSMPITSTAERAVFSRIRFSLHRADPNFRGHQGTLVRRAAKQKTLFIMEIWLSHPDPFHLVEAEFLAPPVIELRRARRWHGSPSAPPSPACRRSSDTR